VFELASGYENSLMLFFYLKSTFFPAYPVPMVSKSIHFEPRKNKLALAPQSRRDAKIKQRRKNLFCQKKFSRNLLF
jgi:hypothetical protein